MSSLRHPGWEPKFGLAPLSADVAHYYWACYIRQVLLELGHPI